MRDANNMPSALRRALLARDTAYAMLDHYFNMVGQILTQPGRSKALQAWRPIWVVLHL
jgi:hypothetical protein